MLTVKRYTLNVPFEDCSKTELMLPLGVQTLTFAFQNGVPQMWALVDTEQDEYTEAVMLTRSEIDINQTELMKAPWKYRDVIFDITGQEWHVWCKITEAELRHQRQQMAIQQAMIQQAQGQQPGGGVIIRPN